MMLDLFLVLDTGDFKDSQHSLEMTDQKFPTVGEAKDHDVSVVECFSVVVDVFEFHVSARVEGDVVEDHHELTQEVIDLFGGL